MFVIICLFLILFYLPAQWVNGKTFWESIAPNEPIMGTIWLLIICSVFFLIYLKIHDDNYMEKEARNNKWVDEKATRTEAIVEYGKKELERKDKLVELNIEMNKLNKEFMRLLSIDIKRADEENWSTEKRLEIKEYNWMAVRADEIRKFLERQKDYQIDLYL